MNNFLVHLLFCSSVIGFSATLPAADRYVSLTGAHVPPFTDWSGAATNIQAAIDAAAPGDTVWVTNGVYTSGGKVMAGDLTNRVALDKPLTLQSVNGPGVTWIQGTVGPEGTNGPFAVRCAWLTNSARLVGFTLQAGGTRTSGSDLTAGGGAWCSSSSSVISNCIIRYNSSFNSGAGVYRGTVWNSSITANQGFTVGGAYQSVLVNCEVRLNTGCGVAEGFLTNCTVTANASIGWTAGGIDASTAVNCIVFANTNGNWRNGSLTYSCSTPLAPGQGNIASDPLFLSDGAHLSADSPCRGAAAPVTAGTDLDGQPWAAAPSMGCDEWSAAPAVTRPALRPCAPPNALQLAATVVGQGPLEIHWTRDGLALEQGSRYDLHLPGVLTLLQPGPEDAGEYAITASNAFGQATATALFRLHCVDAQSPAPAAPYAGWSSAASNIQAAVDVALPGEVVLVTNGIYATGGRAVPGETPIQTNRVVVNKAIFLQSVNGAETTVIQGYYDPAANSAKSVRAVRLGGDATLSGFTIRDGATVIGASAGGIWCASTNARIQYCRILNNHNSGGSSGTYRDCEIRGNLGAGVVRGVLTNCLVAANTNLYGGGVDQGWLTGCTLVGNKATDSGGGAFMATLMNCVVISNTAAWDGGGACGGTLLNCRVYGNVAGHFGGGISGKDSGLTFATARNCWIAFNSAQTGGGASYGGGTVQLSHCTLFGNYASAFYPGIAYCVATNCIVAASLGSANPCSFEVQPQSTVIWPFSGVPPRGILVFDPMLLSDNLHLAPNSPCIGAGTAGAASGTDWDGQPWANPPCIGCDQWLPDPVIATPPGAVAIGTSTRVGIGTLIAGQPPFNCSWTRDGVPIGNDQHFSNPQMPTLGIADFGPADPGDYQMVVSNAVGVVTSAVTRISARYVDAASVEPVAPFTNWLTSATTIQDAIDAADPGDIIFVAPGRYATGGKIKSGTLLNRVALDKPVLVQSVQGPAVTSITGAGATNGPTGVRCAWLGEGASLSGFTLSEGATAGGGAIPVSAGGALWATSPGAVAFNCILTNNTALSGGGAYGGTLKQCLLTRNSAGGAGGAAGSTLLSCTVVDNSAGISPGGVSSSILSNSIVRFNTLGAFPSGATSEYTGSTFSYSCSFPLPPGLGNMDADPQLVDGIHLAVQSPCRAAGILELQSTVDLAGNPWSNPPSLGCYEVRQDLLTGPLAVELSAPRTEVACRAVLPLYAHVEGNLSRMQWEFGDGQAPTNLSALTTRSWDAPGDYLVSCTVFNSDHPEGVVASLPVRVVDLSSPVLALLTRTNDLTTINFTTQWGVSYVIDKAASLEPPINWQTVFNLTGDGAPRTLQFYSTSPSAFYRVRVP